MKRRDYTSFEDFENSNTAGETETLTVLTENGWIKADLLTECKSWKTAVRRFFKALDPNSTDPDFSAWHEAMQESAENGCFKCNDMLMADGSRNRFPMYAYEIEQIDENLWYIFLNIHPEEYPAEETPAEETPEDLADRLAASVTVEEREALDEDATAADLEKVAAEKVLIRSCVSLCEMRPRSAWAKGVQIYASDLLRDMLQTLDEGSAEGWEILHHAERVALCGAQDWREYSEGGCAAALVYNVDIARRLCTPSELRRNHDGRDDPNPRETWIDCQTRALRQAWRLCADHIAAAIKWEGI